MNHPPSGAWLDPRAFLDPPAFLWPGYFWLLNDRLSTDKLLAQLRDMHAMGARSVCLLAEPPEFRPVTFGTELDLPYLGDAYFGMIRTVVAESARLGMNFWLYDEGGWPSGGAAGQVYAADPDRHALRTVVFRESQVGADGRLIVPPDALCGAALVDGTWRTARAGETIAGLPAGAPVREFLVRSEAILYEPGPPGSSSRPAPYIDVLCPAAVAKFIEITHDRFRRHVGDHFGATIRFAFTDEPSVPHTTIPKQLTWTADLAAVFRARKGYDLVPLLPQLFVPAAAGEDPAVTRARIDFHDVVSRLFVERYLAPLRDWCRANGLLSGGHFGGEDEPRYNADGGYGHILRSMRALDLPSVDAIWRQLYPGARSHQFAKYASSAARQIGRPYVMTESFAVYGNGLTPAEMKWVTDQQYVRGANLMVVACYPSSTRDQFMPGERPHFGPVNPLWKYMDLYHAYTARLGYLLSRGRAAVSTAVYFDIRSIWAGGDARAAAIRAHDELARVLLESQCDFDFIDDDLLAGRGSRIDQGRLITGDMVYDTIVVPRTEWMEADALRGLAAFQRGGGSVVAVDGPLATEGGALRLASMVAAPAVEVSAAAALIRPVCRLEPAAASVRACRRNCGPAHLYFLTNEAAHPVRVTARFDETGPAVRWDPEQGRRFAQATVAASGGVAVDLEFDPWGSIALSFGGNAGIDADMPAPRFRVAATRRLESGWTLRPLLQHRVGDHDFERFDRAGTPAAAASLGDWRGVLGEHFSGDAEYATVFDCGEEEARRPARLKLGEVRYACQVTLNGVPVGRRIWSPFALDVSGRLRPGRNELQVVVTNTLANALLDPQVVERWNAMRGPGWPASGHPYDALARRFEPDSAPSGLYGPVVLELDGA